MPTAQQPIGVFDSGVGGLSVLQALRAELPHERFVYLADSGNAPYGERGDAFVAERTHEARSRHPTLPVVGVEPALKPAVMASKTKRIGVIGTRGTLTSTKFAKLLASLHGQAEFIVQPCDGLAHAIERSTALAIPAAPTATETMALCTRYTGAMGRFGSQPGEIDTLVLGCTHYVFVQDELRRLLGPAIELIATGEPVARHTRRLLEAANMLASDNNKPDFTSVITLLTTGTLTPLENAARRWLQLPTHCCATVNLPAG